MTAEVARKRFTVDDYYRMAEAGILREDDRVELIEGEIIEMSPIGSRHAACVSKCARVVERTAGDAYIVRVQSPIRIDKHSEPEPDLVLVPYRSDFYSGGHPDASDALLVIEVMETSSVYDRNVKLPLYAGAGIPEVWLIDLAGDAIEVHAVPEGRRYRDRSVFGPEDRISPRAMPELELAVTDLLP